MIPADYFVSNQFLHSLKPCFGFFFLLQEETIFSHVPFTERHDSFYLVQISHYQLQNISKCTSQECSFFIQMPQTRIDLSITFILLSCVDYLSSFPHLIWFRWAVVLLFFLLEIRKPSENWRFKSILFHLVFHKDPFLGLFYSQYTQSIFSLLLFRWHHCKSKPWFWYHLEIVC